MSADIDLLARLFDEVRDVPPAERAAHFARSGAASSTVAAVERLLTIDATPPTGFADTDLGWRARVRMADALDPAARIGERIDRYTLLELIGQGGSGVVYRARHEGLDRICALKLLAAQLDCADASRFESEARIMARLEHATIAQVFDAGTVAEGSTRTPFIAMEFVDGPPITEFADAHRLGPAARVRLLLAVAEALDHAHRAGVVHRDVKPANVLVAGDAASPRPKLVDFGIAAIVDAHDSARRAGACAAAGTRAYMSPEQASGDLAAIDGRTDVYALAVLATELLGAAATDERVARLLRSAQAHDPSDRPATATEFVRRLKPAIGSRLGTVHAARVTMATTIVLTGVIAITPVWLPFETPPMKTTAAQPVLADADFRAPWDAPVPWDDRELPNPIDVAFSLSTEAAERHVRKFTDWIAANPSDVRTLRLRRGVTNLRLGNLQDAWRDVAWAGRFDRTVAKPRIEIGLPTMIALGWIDLESGRAEAATAIAERGPLRSRSDSAHASIMYELDVFRAACLVGVGDCENVLQMLDFAERWLVDESPVSERVRDIAAVTRIEAHRRLGHPADINVERLHPHAQRIAAALASLGAAGHERERNARPASTDATDFVVRE